MKKPGNPRIAEQLYQNLGKLFYAIAAADVVVSPQEVEALKKIVEEEWLKIDDFQDEYGTDAAYQIEIIFDWLNANDPTAYEAFEDFKAFKKDNERLFEPQLKEKIWHTADNIAEAFAGKNNAEIKMLSNLKSIL